MKKSRYTGEQVAYALRQAELGTPVAEVVRKMGVSHPATACNELAVDAEGGNRDWT